jgi:hypothetical protein
VTWTDAHGDSTNQGMTGNPWDAIYDPVHPDNDLRDLGGGRGQRGRILELVRVHVARVAGRRRVDAGHRPTPARSRRATGPGRSSPSTPAATRPACTECGVFKSVDFGATWTRVSDMTGWGAGWIGSIAWAYNSGFSGMAKTLRRDPSNWGVSYWITPQFVWRSSDWGATFTNLFTPAGPRPVTGRAAA